MPAHSRIAWALLGLLAAALAHAEPVRRVAGEAAWPTQEAPLAWRGVYFEKAGNARLVFPVAEPEQVRTLKRQYEAETGMGAPLRVGMPIAAPKSSGTITQMSWRPVAGGAIARIEVQVTGATAARTGLSLAGADPRLELRFAGSDDPDLVEGMATAGDMARQLDASGLYWSPVTEGDVQYIEIFAPAGTDHRALRVDFPLVSHLVVGMRELASRRTKIGESSSCNVDTACLVDELGQDFVNAKNSIAWMNFLRDGWAYACTGTLLNDTDESTQIPYFHTASHCIASQAEANSLATFWNYEATECNSGVRAQVAQRRTRVYWLATDSFGTGSDSTLLNLTIPPPDYAYFAGWDAAPMDTGLDALTIHHPRGDAKKASDAVSVFRNHNIYIGRLFAIALRTGTAEPGSSGSGVFTPSPQGYLFRGALSRSWTSCETSGDLEHPNNVAWATRFDVFFPMIEQYLDPVYVKPGPGDGRDYTGAWYVPGEPGWGITVFQYPPPENRLFVMAFVYDRNGNAQWYEISGEWTATDEFTGVALESTALPWSADYDTSQRSMTPAGTATLRFLYEGTALELNLAIGRYARQVFAKKL
ncbi:MAG: serine protease [Rhizobium sp.]|nr:serine protease [Rhizobium sp.]